MGKESVIMQHTLHISLICRPHILNRLEAEIAVG